MCGNASPWPSQLNSTSNTHLVPTDRILHSHYLLQNCSELRVHEPFRFNLPNKSSLLLKRFNLDEEVLQYGTSSGWIYSSRWCSLLTGFDCNRDWNWPWLDSTLSKIDFGLDWLGLDSTLSRPWLGLSPTKTDRARLTTVSSSWPNSFRIGFNIDCHHSWLEAFYNWGLDRRCSSSFDGGVLNETDLDKHYSRQDSF